MKRRWLILGLLSLVAPFVAFALYRATPPRAKAEPAPQSSQFGTTEPTQTYSLFAGLWRVDGTLDSTIRVKNSLVVAPLSITPTLYMADGTPYDLPAVNVPAAGVAVLHVNQALASAPISLAGHLSTFGSAELRYQYRSPGHVLGSMEILNLAESLIFTYPFSGIMEEPATAQTLEGLWWRHDPGVGGFVGLTNVTDGPMDVTLQAIGSRGTALPAQSIALQPRATQMLDLDALVGGLSGHENRAGGLRVHYNGKMGEIIASGGLVNERKGYSANIPFWSHASSDPIAITYASAGLMTGFPDPAMGFPRATRFTPYLTLRNATANPLSVTASLNYMAGSMPTSFSLPIQSLLPSETRQVNMQSILATLGLENLSGSINLSFSFTGRAGDLVLATGSVDQTANYVFAVEPEGVGKSFSRIGPYWSVANGFDTMYSLWNPARQAQDFVVSFYYGDGSGKYLLPVHLEAQASTMIDMMMLIESNQPDANGNLIPASVQDGSTVFSSAKGKTEWMTLAVSSAVYNPQTATCGQYCTNCCGYSNFTIAVTSSPGQLAANCTYCDGTVSNEAGSCTWSSNNLSVAKVASGGLVSFGGSETGTAVITATYPSMVVYTGTVCNTTPPSCPTAQPAPTLNIYVSIWCGSLNSSDKLNCYYAQNCPNGTTPSCQPTAFAIPIPAPSPCPKWGIEDDLYTIVGGTKKCLQLGYKYGSANAKNCQ